LIGSLVSLEWVATLPCLGRYSSYSGRSKKNVHAGGAACLPSRSTLPPFLTFFYVKTAVTPTALVSPSSSSLKGGAVSAAPGVAARPLSVLSRRANRGKQGGWVVRWFFQGFGQAQADGRSADRSETRRSENGAGEGRGGGKGGGGRERRMQATGKIHLCSAVLRNAAQPTEKSAHVSAALILPPLVGRGFSAGRLGGCSGLFFGFRYERFRSRAARIEMRQQQPSARDGRDGFLAQPAAEV